jgi:hypothetical protein
LKMRRKRFELLFQDWKYNGAECTSIINNRLPAAGFSPNASGAME